MTNLLTTFNSTTGLAESQDALWEEVNRIFAGFNIAAAAKELGTVFNNLHDEDLLEALETARWTGRPGYPIKVMWRTIITSHVLDIHTIQELIRTLHRNPFIAVHCGISSDKEVPTRFAYYRFTKKLIAHKELIEKCMAKTVDALQEQMPGFGEIIAMDSTEVPTYSDRYKKVSSDHEARWGVKPDRNGKMVWWLGYKMHLLGDAIYQVPLIPVITPANANDSPLLIPVLEKNKALLKRFSPKFVLADKGYDAKENCRAVVEDFKAIPIIDIKRMKRTPNQFEDIADDLGTPYCAWGVPMILWGYDKRQKCLKYRCPLTCGKKGCTWLDKCSKSSYGQVVKIKLKDDYRRFIQVPRHTKRWRELYNQRVSIERIFSWLKKDGDGRVVNHRIRGLDKIALNCLLSVWVTQTKTYTGFIAD